MAQATDPLAGDDERRRLTTLELVGLAAGGTIGSGWLFAAGKVHAAADGHALWSWAIGGVLMLLVAVVMVELSMAAPSSGGLVVWPLRACGPLVAAPVAVAVWASYAINPAAQAAAIVRGLARWWPAMRSLYDPQRVSAGTFLAVGVMALIVVLTMLPSKVVIRASMLLAAYKVLVLLLVVVVLSIVAVDRDRLSGLIQGAYVWVPRHPQPTGPRLVPVLAALTNASIVYAYIGFQAPLDFAGDVRRRRPLREAGRMRVAVYGTVVVSCLLYGGLQHVYDRLWPAGISSLTPRDTSPFVLFAQAGGQEWLAMLVLVAAFAAPLGSGLVFAYALTREVAALSRLHLVHRGLQAARRARLRLGPLDIDAYWLIPLVNLVVGAVILAATRGNWTALTTLNSIPILVAYAVACVALTSLRIFAGVRGTVLRWLSFGVFVAAAQVVLAAGWDQVWPVLLTVAVGTLLVLGLPWLAERDAPVVSRLLWRYDARDHLGPVVSGRWRRAPVHREVLPFLLLMAYAAALVVCSAIEDMVFHYSPTGLWLVHVAALVVSAVAFGLLVTTSRAYQHDQT